MIETGEPIVCYFVLFLTIDYFWVGSLFFKCFFFFLCFSFICFFLQWNTAQKWTFFIVVLVSCVFYTTICAVLLFFYCFPVCCIVLFTCFRTSNREIHKNEHIHRYMYVHKKNVICCGIVDGFFFVYYVFCCFFWGGSRTAHRNININIYNILLLCSLSLTLFLPPLSLAHLLFFYFDNEQNDNTRFFFCLFVRFLLQFYYFPRSHALTLIKKKFVENISAVLGCFFGENSL